MTTSDGTALLHGRAQEWIRIAGVTALTLVIAMLLHHYRGIDHDSQLYSFQAMARLKPELLGNDLYLRFGSQDNYTIFSPLFAGLIAVFGLEPAAALLTFLSQVAFLVTAWLLARELMPRSFAWLGLLIMLTVPGVFGSLGIWNVFEGFATPRLFCESLTLAAIVLALKGRFGIATGVLAFALLIHPLMAMAGVAMVFYLRFAPLPRRLVLSTLLASACAAALVAMLLPADSTLRIPQESVDFIAERQSFLFLTLWDSTDWARAGVYVSMLVLGTVVLPGEALARKICTGSVAITLAGLAIALIGGDLLHLTIVIQGQGWRWMWISTVVAALLSPLIVAAAWKTGPLGKLAATLMLVAWLAIDEPYTILTAPLAIAAAIGAVRGVQVPNRVGRLLLAGMLSLLAIVLCRSFANALLSHVSLPDQTNAPEIVRTIRDFSRDGLLPTAFVFAGWWLLMHCRWRGARAITATACIAFCIALAPASANEWRVREYPQRDYDAFGAWRALIPPGEEVFWIEGSVSTWVLLERPRYITNNQMASVLFSSRASRELRRRARQLAPLAAKQPYIFWPQDESLVRPDLPLTLETLCAAIDARYIVSSVDLAPRPLAYAPPGVSIRYRAMKLFKCAK